MSDIRTVFLNTQIEMNKGKIDALKKDIAKILEDVDFDVRYVLFGAKDGSVRLEDVEPMVKNSTSKLVTVLEYACKIEELKTQNSLIDVVLKDK